MFRFLRISTMLLLFGGVFWFTVQPAAAQSAEPTATCYVYQNDALQRILNSVTFADCAATVAEDGGEVQNFNVGAWNRSYVIVNEEGDVYFRNGRSWRFWDTIERVTVQPSADDLDGDGVLNADDQCADQLETPNGVFDNDGCPDDIYDLLNFATNDLNAYWQTEFDEGNLTYTPPTRVSAYEGRGRYAMNAFYTGGQHAIYYDINLMTGALSSLGDVAPVYILAHEFGHLVQANLGRINNGRYTIQVELEADCLAGSYLQNLEERGLLEEGDAQEGLRQAYAVGDFLPAEHDHAHGSPDQRAEAYTLGYENGADICLTTFN